tara:strand:+ start:10582 stop:10707 length:126 start_codon:yes stop_codon:yes gene_type:complete
VQYDICQISVSGGDVHVEQREVDVDEAGFDEALEQMWMGVA